MNALPQNSHLNGRSPVCTGRWPTSVATSGNVLPQNLQSVPPTPSSIAAAPAMPHACCNDAVDDEDADNSDSAADDDSGGGTVKPPPGSVNDVPLCWLSRLCDSMCRVSLLWCGNVRLQYRHV